MKAHQLNRQESNIAPIEREIKHLVEDAAGALNNATDARHIQQGYIYQSGLGIARIRVTDNTHAAFTVKWPTRNQKHEGDRHEQEFEIDLAFGVEMLNSCTETVTKTRWTVTHDSNIWEVDAFEGNLKGLILAECETETPYIISIPSWIGEDVTGDARYRNENLSRSQQIPSQS